MKIQDALYYKLTKSDGATFAIIAKRGYAVHAPQDATFPLLIFTLIGGVYIPHTSGSDSINPDAPRFSIESQAKTLDAAQNLAAAVESDIQDFTGNLAAGSEETVTVQRIFKETNDVETYNVDIGVYTVSQEYIIWY